MLIDLIVAVPIADPIFFLISAILLRNFQGSRKSGLRDLNGPSSPKQKDFEGTSTSRIRFRIDHMNSETRG